MAHIDELFKATVGQGMSDLVLIPGEVPLIRKGSTIL